MARVIGIDLGTTNTCVAYVEDGMPTIISNKAGYKITPSVVAITPSGKRLVGHAAKRQALTNPSNTVFAAKRLIGRSWDSPSVQAALISSPFDLVEGPNKDVRVKLHGKIYSIPEIQAMILSEMRRIAEEYIKEPVEKAVVTVPAYFKDAQRQATKDAGRIAGLDVIRIVNEPTAAALAYGYGKSMHKKIAVYDLGGGTFDISVLEINEGVYEVLTSNGDTFLGGEDFDSRIMEWVLDEFYQDYGIDLREDKMAIQRLKDAAESAKISLSTVQETEINLPFIATDDKKQPLHIQKKITREDLEGMVEDLIERTIDICARALRDANLKPEDLDSVLLVGGQTRMPLIQARVTDFFQNAPYKTLNPDEAVSLGAAIQGNMLLESQEQSTLLLDLTPYNLGIMVAGGYFKEIIPKDSPIPISKSHMFTTESDFQEKVRVVVVQGGGSKGEGEGDEESAVLGEFILEDIKRAPRGETKIKVFFELDSNGVLKVSARDMDTSKQQTISLSAYSYLTEKEIRGMIEDSRGYTLEQEADELMQGVRFNIEKTLTSIAEMLPKLEGYFNSSEDNRLALEKIRNLISSADEALRTDNRERMVELEEYLKRTEGILKAALQS